MSLLIHLLPQNEMWNELDQKKTISPKINVGYCNPGKGSFVFRMFRFLFSSAFLNCGIQIVEYIPPDDGVYKKMRN